jgi:mono/diheme cytochrome c family protein
MKKILFIELALTALLAAACASGSSSGAVAATLESAPADYAGKTNPLGADAATAGAAVFKANCASCHGESGHGDGPAGQALDPKPVNLAELQKTAGDDFLFWRVSTGVPGTSMAGWKGVLTEEQLWQVVAYIRTLK